MESNDKIKDPLLAPIHLVSKFTKREEIIEHMNAAINMHLKEKKNIILAYRSPELIGKRNSTAKDIANANRKAVKDGDVDFMTWAPDVLALQLF